jgi:fluoride exporter
MEGPSRWLTAGGGTHILGAVTLLLVAIGGASGAVARYLVDTLVSGRIGDAFPFGILIVNLSGAFLLGLLAALIVDRNLLSPELRAPLVVGFLGAYTTFSTLVLDSWRLVENGLPAVGLLNLVASVGLGIGAVVAGLWAGRAISL